MGDLFLLQRIKQTVERWNDKKILINYQPGDDFQKLNEFLY